MTSYLPTFVEKAMRAWLVDILVTNVPVLPDLPNWGGLTEEKIIYANQNAARPTIPIIAVKMGVVRNIGEPVIVDEIKDTLDPLSDLNRVSDQYKEATISLNVDGFEAYAIADYILQAMRESEQVELNAKRGIAITNVMLDARGIENVKGTFTPQAKIDLSVNYRVGLAKEQAALRTLIETYTVEGV